MLCDHLAEESNGQEQDWKEIEEEERNVGDQVAEDCES